MAIERRPHPTAFASLLRRFRAAAGLSQEELAERAGVSGRSVGNIERGLSRTPYPATVRRLADALGLAAHDRVEFLAAARGIEPLPDVRLTVSVIPSPTTPLVGRERDEAIAVHLLRFEGARLLTLTGPAGVGKTRLAIRLSELLTADVSEILFLPLATLTDPAMVPAAIAAALGIRLTGETEAEEQIVSVLRDRTMLLVLDNLEQLVPSAAMLGRLLEACPELRILTTSRSRLRLRGEHQLEVPPLALPDLHRLPPVDTLAQFPAIELFCRRARATRSSFRLTDSNAPAVAEICVRLDGLPLALELAAARLAVLSPQELLMRLDQRLRLLTAGPADLPTRQQTLRDALRWSYDLLPAAEKRFFCRLGVFAGGATFDSIEQVAGTGQDVLELLSALVDASLVQVVEQDGETRFVMLQTVRELALELLNADSQGYAIRERHAACFTSLATASEDGLSGPEQSVWLARLDREYDNVRTALEWCESAARVEQGLRLAAPLWRYWGIRGRLGEGRRVLQHLLANESAAVAGDVHLRARFALGALLYYSGLYAQARSLWLECLGRERLAGDRSRIALVLNALGTSVQQLGNLDEAARFYQESAAIRRELGDAAPLATVLSNVANVSHYRGRLHEAVAEFEEALAICRTEGIFPGLTLDNLAQVYLDLADYGRSLELCRESLQLSREHGHREMEAQTLGTLTCAELIRGEPRRAWEVAIAALPVVRSLGERSNLAVILINAAHAAAVLGDVNSALAYGSESLALVVETGNRRLESQVRWGLGFIHLMRSDLSQAASHADEALLLSRETGYLVGIAEAQNLRASIARRRGDLAAVPALHAEAAAIRHAVHAPIHAAYRQLYDLDQALAREALGDMRYRAAWEAGWKQGSAICPR